VEAFPAARVEEAPSFATMQGIRQCDAIGRQIDKYSVNHDCEKVNMRASKMFLSVAN
jgi:hypothetical protein